METTPPLEQKEKLDLSILCADDDEVNRKLLKRMLDPRYNIVKVVESGQALLQELESNSSYDCILSDNTMLPDMQGVDALKQIRAKGNQIPFILFTTDSGGDLQPKVESLGGVFLSKPASRDVLRSTIERAIEAGK